jgi:hypothetical protein
LVVLERIRVQDGGCSMGCSVGYCVGYCVGRAGKYSHGGRRGAL